MSNGGKGLPGKGAAPGTSKAPSSPGASCSSAPTSAADKRKEGAAKAAQDIKDGKIIDSAKLKKESQDALTKFQKTPPEIGQTAKELAPKLAGKKEKEVLDHMEEEVKAGKCVKSTTTIPGPTPGSAQTMVKYEYPDGTMVRYKPDGDKFRPGPTMSVEVKHTPKKPDGSMNPDKSPDDIAFKVDETGAPVPKNPSDVKNPFDKGKDKDRNEGYTDRAMSAGHKSLSK
jgi:hypothetical protein